MGNVARLLSGAEHTEPVRLDDKDTPPPGTAGSSGAEDTETPAPPADVPFLAAQCRIGAESGPAAGERGERVPARLGDDFVSAVGDRYRLDLPPVDTDAARVLDERHVVGAVVGKRINAHVYGRPGLPAARLGDAHGGMADAVNDEVHLPA